MKHLVLAAMVVALVACGDDDDASVDAGGRDAGSAEDAGLDAGGEDTDAGPDAGGDDDDAGPDAGTETDAGPVGPCGDPATRPVVTLDDGTILDEDTTWVCTNIYQLDGLVFVAGDRDDVPVLTIEAGTLVRGVEGDVDEGIQPGALIVTRRGRIDARGTPEQPIVMTADAEVGSREPGGWGGLVMLGRATNNIGETEVEGLAGSLGDLGLHGYDVALATGDAGMPDAGADGDVEDPEWDCGSLTYVRIEFAGFQVTGGDELNGLTLGSCGRGTTIDHVHVHLGQDDGVELFGGTVDLSHVIITGHGDDGLDVDLGYQGRVQFLVIQQHPEITGGSAFEWNNQTDLSDVAEPRTRPILYNATIVGKNTTESNRGLHLRQGVQAYVRNAIVMGFGAGAVDVDGQATAAGALAGDLSVDHTVFRGVGAVLFPSDDNDDPDGAGALPALIEEDYFLKTGIYAGEANAPDDNVEEDPMLTMPFDIDAPDWTPMDGSPAETTGETPMDPDGLSDFFDDEATYLGAIDPDGDDWTAWTEYPED